MSDYINQQNKKYKKELELAEMMKEDVNKISDVRVHLILYLVSGHSLKGMDQDSLDFLSNLAPTIPIISKADTFQRQKLKVMKK